MIQLFSVWYVQDSSPHRNERQVVINASSFYKAHIFIIKVWCYFLVTLRILQLLLLCGAVPRVCVHIQQVTDEKFTQ